MADIISVNSAAMREKASSFRKIAESIRTYTDDMKNAIDKLGATYEGQAYEATKNAFAKYQSTFTEKYETILAYAKFLEEAANNYDKTEQTNAQQ